MRPKTLILSLATALSLTAGAIMAQTSQPVTVEGGTLEEARAFIQRYLSYYDPIMSTSISIASLPNLPFELPLPPGRTYGSVARIPSDQNISSSYEIYLETSLSLDELSNFMTTSLGADWTTVSVPQPQGGGFSTVSSIYGQTCKNGAEASLNYDAFQSNGQATLLTLRLQIPGDEYACNQDVQNFFSPGSLLPSLRQPEGVSVGTFSGGGGSVDSTLNIVDLQSSLPADALHAAYAQQLVAQGWQEVSSQVNPESAVSRWTLPDADERQWAAVMTIIQGSQPGKFYASLVIEPR